MPYYDENNNRLNDEQIRTHNGPIFDDYNNRIPFETLLMYKFDTAGTVYESDQVSYSSGGSVESARRSSGACLVHVISIGIASTATLAVWALKISQYDPILAMWLLTPVALVTLIYVPMLGRKIAGPHPTDLLLYTICSIGIIVGLLWWLGLLSPLIQLAVGNLVHSLQNR
jgi:hypothetical protein